MDRTEIFYKVKNHLLKQNKRSLKWEDGLAGVGDSECAYRGLDGLSCAVGCLIPDKFYDEAIEGMSVYYEEGQVTTEIMNVLSRSLSRPLEPEDLKLLRSLQITHDTVDPVRWEERLSVLEGSLVKRKVIRPLDQ